MTLLFSSSLPLLLTHKKVDRKEKKSGGMKYFCSDKLAWSLFLLQAQWIPRKINALQNTILEGLQYFANHLEPFQQGPSFNRFEARKKDII